MQYVLASASPRRKELLSNVVEAFEIIPSDFDEAQITGDLSPKKLVKKLAEGKASDVAFRKENEGKIVLGSDTVVAFGKKVLGKPKDEADATDMLKTLSGKKHYVYTGVCLVKVKAGEIVWQKTAAAKTAVYFEKLSDEFIASYVAGGSPMDKAGAYGIQDGGLVKRIKGSYSCVVGLPVELVEKMVKKAEKQR
jgi:septum formation protein